MEKKRVDEVTRDFYSEKRWRARKLRMFSKRRSSQDKFLNRVAEKYGDECEIFYGDWSSTGKCKECTPSPVVGFR